MKTRKAVFLHTRDLEQYSYPENCPFNTERASMTRNTLASMGLLRGAGRSERAPENADRSDLERFHSAEYLDALQRAAHGDLDADSFAMGLGTLDCPVFQDMYDYAALASGATITGARLILTGQADAAFNPSGGYHHAGPDYAAGFCYINDIVLAAIVLADAGKRVLDLDLDVHHCDGVQNAFYERRDVMTISMHESGKTLFPGTGFVDEIGSGEGEGYSVNIPLPPGTCDAIYEKAFREAALPLMKAFDPEVIIIQLGMDALSGDPLAHLNLTNNVHADIIGMVLELKKPVLATGGGGYNVDNTVRGWTLAWSVLCGEETEHANIGMGGIMLANTEWPGGLRDRLLISDVSRTGAVDYEVETAIEEIRNNIFPLHGI